jgi:hypothetical protein
MPIAQDSVEARGRPARSWPAGRTIAYWVVSLPVLAETAVGIQWDLARIPFVTDVLARLGFPVYLATILGIAKILALVALLAPGFPRLNEWAYAGLFFVYAGAAASHLAIGDTPANIITPAVFAVITLVSWGLRPPSRRDPVALPRALRLAPR